MKPLPRNGLKKETQDGLAQVRDRKLYPPMVTGCPPSFVSKFGSCKAVHCCQGIKAIRGVGPNVSDIVEQIESHKG